jgi:hypothetical protein
LGFRIEGPKSLLNHWKSINVEIIKPFIWLRSLIHVQLISTFLDSFELRALRLGVPLFPTMPTLQFGSILLTLSLKESNSIPCWNCVLAHCAFGGGHAIVVK